MSQSSSSSTDSSSSSIDFDPIDLIPHSNNDSNNQESNDPQQTSTTGTQLHLLQATTDINRDNIHNFPIGPSSLKIQGEGNDNDPRNTNSNDNSKIGLNVTVASRSWTSQRKGKSIRIDSNNDEMAIEDLGNETGDDQSNINPGQSSQRIKELCMIENQLSSLLDLAGEAISCLSITSKPPIGIKRSTLSKGGGGGGGENENDGNGSRADKVQKFSRSIVQYFETLNKVQLGLRTSMSNLRSSKVSIKVLFETSHTSVPNCPIGLGDLNRLKNLHPRTAKATLNNSKANSNCDDEDRTIVDDEDERAFFEKRKKRRADSTEADDSFGLSVASRIVERDALLDLINSLEKLISE